MLVPIHARGVNGEQRWDGLVSTASRHVTEHGCVIIGARLRGHRRVGVAECKDELADAGARHGLGSVCFLPISDLSPGRSAELDSSDLSGGGTLKGCYLAVMGAKPSDVDSALGAFGLFPRPHRIGQA